MTSRASGRDTDSSIGKPQQQFPQEQYTQHSQYPPQDNLYQSSQQSTPAAAQSQKSPNTAMIVGVVFAIVALLLGVAGMLAWNMGVFERKTESAPPTVVEIVTETAEAVSTDGANAQAGGSGNEQDREPAPSSEEPDSVPALDRPKGSDYTSYSAATSVTSEEFAQSVFEAYKTHVDRTGTTNGTVYAYSPVTGQSYSMNCINHTSYVSCTGGNNAVVHIS